MTVIEVAQRFRVSPRTVQGWVHRRRIPHLKIGPKLIRFRVQDLESVIAFQEMQESENGDH